MPFQVQIGERVWRTDDLTMKEACRIQVATGHGWLQINPFRDAEDAKAIIVAFLSREMSEDAATDKADAMSIQEVLDAIDKVDDDLPDTYQAGIPKAEGDPTTTGSSGRPEPSDGPQT